MNLTCAQAHVDDLDDPRLDPYRALRERALALEAGLFVVEGHLVLERLLATEPGALVSALVEADKASRHAALLARLPADATLFTAPRAIVEQLVGFDVHRGVLAAARRRVRGPEFLAASPGTPGVVLALEALSNHDNVGGLFRTAAALGARGVLVDDRTADPLYRKAIRVSMGTVFDVPWGVAPHGALVATLEAAGYVPWALTPATDAIPLDAVLDGRVEPPSRVALVVGAEGPGLTRATLDAAARKVSIPMASGVDSLNVGTAAAIALHAVRHALERRVVGVMTGA